MTQPLGARQTREGRKYSGLPSVTTVLGIIAKHGLPWGAAKESALFAVYHYDEWKDLAPAEAVERIKRHHKGVWTDKGARGTEIHNIAQRWTLGETVDVPADYEPYVDALEAFWVDHRPKWLHVERTVLDRTHGYGGTFDAIADLNGPVKGTLLVDFKTGGRYPAETILQLAAYRYAECMAVYDDKGVLVDTEPMPEVDGCAVLYLCDDGTYELLELPADEEAHTSFLTALALWQSMKDYEGWVTRHPRERERETVG